ncbi:MAG: hypothetical protein ACXVFI_20045 [Solirubrobacteraceae bacterium]
MSPEDPIIERLDRLSAILRLAHRDAIDRARATIRADKVNAAILDASGKWIGTAALQTAVTRKTKAAQRTIQLRIVDLLAEGILEKRGGGRATEYRSSGLV